MFADKQTGSMVKEDSLRLYQLVVNGGIRWNSTHDMIERALKLRNIIDLYQLEFYDELKEGALSRDDWLELKELLELLRPLKKASLCVQSNYGNCYHGALQESLESTDFLISKLEEKKRKHSKLSDSHLRACINLGWKWLYKYYALGDQTPAYRIAILLHTNRKMTWFDNHWSHRPLWIQEVKEVARELFSGYARRYSNEVGGVAAVGPRSRTWMSLSDTTPVWMRPTSWMI